MKGSSTEDWVKRIATLDALDATDDLSCGTDENSLECYHEPALQLAESESGRVVDFESRVAGGPDQISSRRRLIERPR